MLDSFLTTRCGRVLFLCSRKGLLRLDENPPFLRVSERPCLGIELGTTDLPTPLRTSCSLNSVFRLTLTHSRCSGLERIFRHLIGQSTGILQLTLKGTVCTVDASVAKCACAVCTWKSGFWRAPRIWQSLLRCASVGWGSTGEFGAAGR